MNCPRCQSSILFTDLDGAYCLCGWRHNPAPVGLALPTDAPEEKRRGRRPHWRMATERVCVICGDKFFPSKAKVGTCGKECGYEKARQTKRARLEKQKP